MNKSTITRERLEQLADNNTICKVSWDERIELAQISLAAMDSEPVAEVLSNRPGNDTSIVDVALPVGTQLYRHAQPAPEYPETLPCPVLLEPGLRFGKGIKTSTMLAALSRRAVYESDLSALSPEERAEFQAGIEDVKALIAQPVPVAPICTCPSGDGSLRWPCPVHPGNSPVIPDGSASMLRRWLAFGRGMQNAGSQLPHNLIAETEAMLAAAPQLPGSETAAVPGKWIPVSERMPEMGEHQCYVLAADFKNNYWPNIPNTQVGVYGDWFGDGNPAWDDGDGEDLHLKEVTHWMPLPAAPLEV
ncbi:Eaa1 [Klebsiella pneumoniae]|uniref:DUF551 domain-containing protein n=1 Tax=Klebsiella TaxID=570 RepID=UPI0010D2B81F|nr:DUF551 domain-containing protein [Klebsiella pneumoniae]MCQ0976360.1 DUF551 domain-containing protein [Klebsiella pneumoniae]MDM7058279.1 DUF551 domain-containing protein [Klebsiella pneumoniae]VGB74504.1 Eaa1 [Klebsiella pneumoniae]VGD24305.1 Eaa1 [Klebsiella pneumoniae]